MSLHTAGSQTHNDLHPFTNAITPFLVDVFFFWHQFFTNTCGPTDNFELVLHEHSRLSFAVARALMHHIRSSAAYTDDSPFICPDHPTNEDRAIRFDDLVSATLG